MTDQNKYIDTLNGVNKYSKKIQGDFTFSFKGVPTNFKVREFACHDGSDEILIDGSLVDLVQACRNKFGVTTINSAYRTLSWNAHEGGAKNSQHVQGKAADIVCKNTSPLEVAMFAEAYGAGGVGLYTSFTHVDTRSGKARWNSTSGREVGVTTFLQTIKLGSVGKHVEIAQKYLKIKVTGCFDETMKQATIDFQKSHDLEADAIIGVKTWTKLLTA